MKINLSIENIKDEIAQIRKRNPGFKDDSAFVFWFLKSFLVDSDEAARNSLTGDSSDKNIDAIYIDEKAHQVSIIQGKFRESKNHLENRNDVLSLADLGNYPWESKEFFFEED